MTDYQHTYTSIDPAEVRRLRKNELTRLRRDCKPHDPYEGKLTACPDCGGTWETAHKRWIERVCGVRYDYFACCKGNYARYDV